MATLEQLEESLESSEPVELYRFVLGSEEFFFTSSEDTITLDGDAYAPEAIGRNTVALGRDDKNRPLEIQMPATNAFAANYRPRSPGIIASVTITRLQRQETPAIGTTRTLVYKGLVRSVRFPEEGHRAIVGCTSIEAAQSRPVPRFTFSGLCNHYLYDGGCKVDSIAHRFIGVVTVESGLDITVPGVSAQPDGTYNAGYVKPSGVPDFRLVIKHVGDVLTLLLPFAAPVLSQSVEVYKGCDHKIDGDCQNEFANTDEFGGYPYVPFKNPFETGL